VETAIVTALIALVGSIVAAIFTYWSTKSRERAAEWRKEKLSYYKALIESFSGIVGLDSTAEGQRQFTKANNNILLFAPSSVINALREFRNAISTANHELSIDEHDKLLATLLLEIRRDIGVTPQDSPETFRPRLWASGATEKEK
jgi:hypothetical protein